MRQILEEEWFGMVIPILFLQMTLDGYTNEYNIYLIRKTISCESCPLQEMYESIHSPSRKRRFIVARSGVQRKSGEVKRIRNIKAFGICTK